MARIVRGTKQTHNANKFSPQRNPFQKKKTYLALLGKADKLALVGLQALDVGIQTLGGEVAAAVVDRDANAGCDLAGDLGGLENTKVRRVCGQEVKYESESESESEKQKARGEPHS
jgi:hypothetical protein